MNLLHHEFWAAPVFYTPIFFSFLKNAFKLGSLNYFCWANPKIENGGFIGYSKLKLLEQLPKDLIPRTLVLDPKISFSDVESLIINEKYSYPFIAKPDKGARGYRVRYIEKLRDFRDYHKTAKQPYLIQDYIDLPKEYGVFIVRTEEQFYISSLVDKEFLALEGDGKSSLEALYNNHERASKYFRKSDLPAYLDRVLLPSERVLLEPIGNHSRGTKFVNANMHVDDQLRATFEKLVLTMPDFYYGRFDVKANSLEDLKKGLFRIIEVNGVSSEPGHIYDPKYPLESAYRDLFWHWDKMSEIASKNKAQGRTKESFVKTFISLLDYYKNR